jgi:hypothetical protein
VRGQLGFEALAQGRIAVARTIEENGPLGSRFTERGSEQHFFPILRRWHVCLRFASPSLCAHSAD